MYKHQLNFDYPPELIATEPKHPPRVLKVNVTTGQIGEVTFDDFKGQFTSRDAMIFNRTRVVPRRIHTADVEILFIAKREVQPGSGFEDWEVLMPAKSLGLGAKLDLPGGVQAELIEKGRPQILRVHGELTATYFYELGDMPLPPYIQKMRNERRAREQDKVWYQTYFSTQADGKGPAAHHATESLAAPTASLHFREEDVATIRTQGARIACVDLEVGLGTFLPLAADDLSQHQMHSELAICPKATWELVDDVRRSGGRVYAVGTTVVRTLESVQAGKLKPTQSAWVGETDLFIYPPYKCTSFDTLCTNFHQPESTLMALIMAFAGEGLVQRAYQFAIERRFRLFSYGDLTVWEK